MKCICTLLMAALAGGTATLAHAADDEVTTLGNIVVTATGYEQMVEDAPASITVIPREALEKRAYRDVTDALEDVPGVVITGGGSTSDISIRGMAPSYTMILIDGKRQNSRETRPNADGPGIEQGWLPPLSAIERIEVIRGPMSSLYGSDAMGGVINVITRKIPEEWTGSVRLEGTMQEDSRSGNEFQSNVYLAGSIVPDRLGLQFYGRKSRREEDRILNGFNRGDVDSGTLKLTLAPNRDHDLVAEVSRTLQERASYPGKSISELTSQGKPNTPSITPYAHNRYALTHHGRWGRANSESYIQRDETNNPARDMFLRDTTVHTRWTLPLGKHFLSVGAQYQREQLQDNGNEFDADVNNLSRYQWALFAEDEWLITEDFALTAGLRMTEDENYGTHWTPRLYAVWHATDRFSIKGGVSTGFKAPGLRQAVADWGQITGGRGGVPAIIMGNPDLKPEKSISEELALVWDDRQGWVSSLTFFNTDFRDKISEVRTCTDPTGGQGCHVRPGDEGYRFISNRVNVDRAVMRGVEATTSWDVTDALRLAANYTYTYSRQKSGPFEGSPLNKMPKHMFNATADWAYDARMSFWTRMNFRGRTSDYLSRVDMAEGTPSFTFFDLGLNYDFNKHVNAGIGVYNIFDKRVTDEVYGMIPRLAQPGT